MPSQLRPLSELRGYSLHARDGEIGRLKEALEQERDYLREEVQTSGRFGEIIGGDLTWINFLGGYFPLLGFILFFLLL